MGTWFIGASIILAGLIIGGEIREAAKRIAAPLWELHELERKGFNRIRN